MSPRLLLLSTSGQHELKNQTNHGWFRAFGGAVFTIYLSIFTQRSSLLLFEALQHFHTFFTVTAKGKKKKGICCRTNARNGTSPGRARRWRVEPCKRTPRRRAVGEKKGNELIYFHKSMGKILVPSEIRADLRFGIQL